MDLWVSTNKGLFRMAGDGRGLASKSHFFPGVSSPVMLPPDASGLGLAALKHGHFGSKLHRTLDGGITWTPVATPAYPEYPKDLPPDINPVSGKPTPWNLELIWSIERGGLPNEFWLGTIPGGLFRSTDGGATWSLCEPLWNDPRRKSWFGGGYDHAGIHSICVDPTDPAHLVLAVSTAGVWETRDSGATWAQIGHGMIATYMPPGQQTDPAVQDVHRMAACPTSFRHMWVQHHCGMFRSEDAGHTFAKVGPDMGADPSGFGFAVAVHPTDPETAWFVPATSAASRWLGGSSYCGRAMAGRHSSNCIAACRSPTRTTSPTATAWTSPPTARRSPSARRRGTCTSRATRATRGPRYRRRCRRSCRSDLDKVQWRRAQEGEFRELSSEAAIE